jgi:hypothetical protein
MPSRTAFTVNGARRIAQLSDGMSNTLLYAEVKTFQPRLKCGGLSVNNPFNARSYHPGGVNALVGDGSVRFVKSTIDGMVWRALGTIAGGEIVSGDSF